MGKNGWQRKKIKMACGQFPRIEDLRNPLDRRFAIWASTYGSRCIQTTAKPRVVSEEIQKRPEYIGFCEGYQRIGRRTDLGRNYTDAYLAGLEVRLREEAAKKRSELEREERTTP